VQLRAECDEDDEKAESRRKVVAEERAFWRPQNLTEHVIYAPITCRTALPVASLVYSERVTNRLGRVVVCG
jgi:hypothetical protein